MKKYLLSLLVLVSPAFAFAVQAVSNIDSLFAAVKDILNLILPILISLAVIYFIWSLLSFLKDSGSKKDEARSQMIWGIVIIFVMVSIWGLVGILSTSVSSTTTGAPDVTGLIPTGYR